MKPEICDLIIKHIGWSIPFYLQAIFDVIRTNLPEERHEITATDVEKAFEDLLNPSKRNKFDYWRQRLSEELGTPDDFLAIQLLNAICQDTTGTNKATLSQVLSQHIADPDNRQTKLTYLLDILTSDGYLEYLDDRYSFRLILLREYWRRWVLS